MGNNVVIVGGGISGLAASIFLARGGRTVTLFEKRRYLGGRAITHLRHGFRFNLGPHAFYRGGVGSQVLRELGIPVRGGMPDGSGVALLGDQRYKLPTTIWSLFTTGLFTAREKLEAAKLLLRIRRMKKPRPQFASMSVRQWLDQYVQRPRVRQTLDALFRLATYCHEPDRMNAAAALAQLRLAMRGVIYVDEGWQKIVDALHSAAVAAGVNFITSSHVVRIDADGSVGAVYIGELEEDPQDTASVLASLSTRSEVGTRLAADAVLLAVEPSTARKLLGEMKWPEMVPVTLSTLDVALSSLPRPTTTFAVGIDRPLYFSVHSKWAQLTPKGGALIHVSKYGAGAEEELEALLDDLQPGWREVVVHRRFLPSMVVSNSLLPPAPGTRPDAVTPIRGLYLSGDWVGDVGLLSDASLASARAAARAILASSS